MSVFSICLGRMPFCWMSPSMLVMFSRAWLVWSCAAETALGDAVVDPSLGEVWSLTGSALFWVVRLGGHKVRSECTW